MILCARSTSRSREQSMKRRPSSENMFFLLSIVKITRFYDYQTWPTHLFDKFTRCAKVCGLFFPLLLCFLGADWLGRETPITWCAWRQYQMNSYVTSQSVVLLLQVTWIIPRPRPRRSTVKDGFTQEILDTMMRTSTSTLWTEWKNLSSTRATR